jgi:hypothetical protein
MTDGWQPVETWQNRLQAASRDFLYPPTPDIAGQVRRRLEDGSPRRAAHRRLAWVAAILLLLAGLMAVPPVRAAVLRILRVGAVEILPAPPMPSATPAPETAASPSATPAPSPTPLRSVLQLAGETTLAKAEAEAGFPIRLPGYPPDLGPPDRVFLQDLNGPVVVLVWLDSSRPDGVRLSLHQLGPGTFAQKVEPTVIAETSVDGEPALWTEGPHLFQFRRGSRVDLDARRLVKGNVLIWMEGEITYRVETYLPMEEAIRIAESLR